MKTQLTPNSVKRLRRERRGFGATFLIPSASQRPWSLPVGYQCVYESYFRDDMKLWFPIPRLVTAYTRHRDAAISQFLNGSWRITVALMVMAAEIDTSLSVRTFEELTSVSSLEDGLLSIKMRPSYNVIGGILIRRSIGRADHPTSREYPEEFLANARAIARLAQEHWGNISWERVHRSIDRISRREWDSSYLPSVNKTKRRISLFTGEEQKKINAARKMTGLPYLSAMMAGELGLSHAEPLVPPNELATDDVNLASSDHRESSLGVVAAAPKKKKSKKRAHDEPPVNDDRETLPKGGDRSEGAEPSTKKRRKKKRNLWRIASRCDGVSNFVIEKYDSALKEALAESEKLKKTVVSKSRLLRRRKADWQEEFERMAEKRDCAVARRKAQKKRADAAEEELSVVRSTIEALELHKANLMEEIGAKAVEHKKELDRLRDSRIYEVTKERVRVETEMIAKSNKHFGNLREW
ncbi:PREDICTED: uncharacterized protein LOC106314364 [Brassica oleracea var. oleracea]|uniref:uncharacterized protein LOC106314364 n=1 Tax=Brassica oleracea var. oleracea TaxID=109376 RepID=UPI0006A6E5C6|nr:PREDICTED: uncharacterized protein LOC106314364 [Brassica oleracea var. oleracea]